MRNIAFLILIYIGVAFGCNNSATLNSPEKEDSAKPAPQTNETKPATKPEVQQPGIPDFLKISKNIKEWDIKFLQGVEKSDSSGPYLAGEFVSDTLSFDLLFYPKDGNKTAVRFNAIHEGKQNNYKDLICFAFVYLMKNPDSMKDYHDDNTVYPATVKAYVRKETIWNFSSESKVNTLKELSQFEIRSMYANLK